MVLVFLFFSLDCFNPFGGLSWPQLHKGEGRRCSWRSSTQGAFGGGGGWGVGSLAQGHLSSTLKVSSQVFCLHWGLEPGTLRPSVPPPTVIVLCSRITFFLSNQCCCQSSNSHNLHFLIIKPEAHFLNHQSWDSAVTLSQNRNRNHNIGAKQTPHTSI